MRKRCIFIIKLKSLIKSLIIPWIVGGLASFLTRNSMSVYGSINLPPLAPPSWLFPIAWGLLYTLMGVSSYIVFDDKPEEQPKARKIYIFQLIVNFLWPILFFNFRAFFLALLCLIILLISVIYMTVEFYKIKPIAAYLQVPYIMWLMFATYLNLGMFLLNN